MARRNYTLLNFRELSAGENSSFPALMKAKHVQKKRQKKSLYLPSKCSLFGVFSRAPPGLSFSTDSLSQSQASPSFAKPPSSFHFISVRGKAPKVR